MVLENVTETSDVLAEGPNKKAVLQEVANVNDSSQSTSLICDLNSGKSEKADLELEAGELQKWSPEEPTGETTDGKQNLNHKANETSNLSGLVEAGLMVQRPVLGGCNLMNLDR